MNRTLIDQQQAITVARNKAQQLFSDDGAQDFYLEEFEVDEKTDDWLVTISFVRPVRRQTQLLTSGNYIPNHRLVKVVRINARSGEVTSVKNRETQSAE
jgi:uncharacterized protein (UPF0248 family)